MVPPDGSQGTGECHIWIRALNTDGACAFTADLLFGNTVFKRHSSSPDTGGCVLFSCFIGKEVLATGIPYWVEGLLQSVSMLIRILRWKEKSVYRRVKRI